MDERADTRRALLEWRDGETLTASLEEGWVCRDDGVAQLLNLGWPLRDRVSRAGHDLLSVKVREVAKIFSARLVEIGIVSPGRL